MSKKIIVGLVGSVAVDQCRARWNTFLREQGSACEFQFYRTRSKDELELRLSEMFTLDRRGYVLDQEFQAEVLRLLDRLDESAEKVQRVDTIMNEGGILKGYFLDAGVNDAKEERIVLWQNPRKEHVA